ncbi:MAG: nitrous oxide reductase accessory protein NosL [Campylobacterota bacterium]|nr:nitrous oxide reductase accessory protein NosL [Campylobacterota bacterium]
MKLTISIGVIVAALLTGCASNTKSSMYQSVQRNDAVILQTNKDKMFCVKCGMKLPKFYKTNHAALHKGEMRQYCSLHCLVADLNDGNDLKNPKVVDVTSLKFIDASQAFYVVGSKKRGTMSRVSKYAFKDQDDAKAFQKEFSGKILDLHQAINKTQRDFR